MKRPYSGNGHCRMRMRDPLCRPGHPYLKYRPRGVRIIPPTPSRVCFCSCRAWDEAPAALKESAQQLTQQLTGQQLLLSTERNATFTQITVLVPLVHEDGEQTAAISIQSRKNAKGELDSENCRLLFDLHMKWLGNTIADVMVTDKQVHLKILNDHPGIGSLLDHGANRLAEALESLGYKLASLQTDAYPALAPEQREEEGLHNRARSPAFRTAAYKGVDLRI